MVALADLRGSSGTSALKLTRVSSSELRVGKVAAASNSVGEPTTVESASTNGAEAVDANREHHAVECAGKFRFVQVIVPHRGDGLGIVAEDAATPRAQHEDTMTVFTRYQENLPTPFVEHVIDSRNRERLACAHGARVWCWRRQD